MVNFGQVLTHAKNYEIFHVRVNQSKHIEYVVRDWREKKNVQWSCLLMPVSLASPRRNANKICKRNKLIEGKSGREERCTERGVEIINEDHPDYEHKFTPTFSSFFKPH